MTTCFFLGKGSSLLNSMYHLHDSQQSSAFHFFIRARLDVSVISVDATQPLQDLRSSSTYIKIFIYSLLRCIQGTAQYGQPTRFLEYL